MALIAAHLNAGIILVVTVQRQVYNIPLPSIPYPLPPFSPSLISLMVSVDVKHHVYLLIYRQQSIYDAKYSVSIHYNRDDDAVDDDEEDEDDDGYDAAAYTTPTTTITITSK